MNECIHCDDPDCTEDADTRARFAEIPCPGEVHGWWCSAWRHEDAPIAHLLAKGNNTGVTCHTDG